MAGAMQAALMSWWWRGITSVGDRGSGVSATLGVEHL
jgi:hypothetical protein